MRPIFDSCQNRAAHRARQVRVQDLATKHLPPRSWRNSRRKDILDPRITVLRMQIEMAVKQKKIRQLLESARARMEQDEIPLALDKIREVLEMDPENPDALAMRETMEKQRQRNPDRQVVGASADAPGQPRLWRGQACGPGSAGHPVGDARALDLLEKIESTETDAKRIREQKEQLYSSAMKAYQRRRDSTPR